MEATYTQLSNYLMSDVEYMQYKNSILSKTNSGNIHDVTGQLAALKNFTDLAILRPEAIELCVKNILKIKASLYLTTK